MRVDIHIPESWKELNDSQMLFVSKLHLEALPKVEFLSLCLMHFTNLKLIKKPQQNGHFLFKKCGEKFTIDADMWYTLCDKLNWMVDEVGEIKNPTKIGRTFGCNQRLYGVTLEQMLLADNYYSACNQGDNVNMLSMFTAVFYKRKWQRFKSEKLKQRSKYFKSYKAQMRVVLMWYTGVRVSLRERFPYLYKSTEEGVSQSPEQIVLSILSALNGGDITKNKELYKSPCIEALQELNNLAERAAKLKK